jgi:hypothetical protein
MKLKSVCDKGCSEAWQVGSKLKLNCDVSLFSSCLLSSKIETNASTERGTGTSTVYSPWWHSHWDHVEDWRQTNRRGHGSEVQLLIRLRFLYCLYKWFLNFVWFLTIREEHKLRVFEEVVQRWLFGSKWEEIIGDWRKLRNEGLHNLYY